ncbi:MAG: hypothetical protein L3K02_06430, partial [Thermoplasmata archaeon]|nr:hypothetical protein [Thermoplasmata archaeon]
MATANAPASVLKVKALALPDADQSRSTGLPKATWALIIGGTVGIVFWVLAALSWEGTLTFVLRPGTTLGLDSAIDYIVFGMIAMMAPYGFIKSREL